VGDLDRTKSRPKVRGADHYATIPVREVLWPLVEEELQHGGALNPRLDPIDVDAPVYGWRV
jgi:hypothetical protein